MKTLIVMLLWVGHHNGGPATIQGFASLAECEAAIPAVRSFYDPYRPAFGTAAVRCVDLRSAPR